MIERSPQENTSVQKTKPAKAGKVARTAKKAKKRVKKIVTEVIAHVLCTKNNTIVTVTDLQGNTISWGSSGKCGYRGTKKPTPAAAGEAAKDAIMAAIQACGAKEVEVIVKGPGAGRESAVRACHAAGLRVNSIEDITPIPHGGCRPKKKRRV